MPRIVCLSDTHNYHEEIIVPDGDILIHAGDATMRGTNREIAAFNRWLSALPHRHKIFVAGNHDWLFETDNPVARKLLDDSIVYLQDSSVEIESLKIYGAPWQPRFYDWAFNLNRGREIAEKWSLIPANAHIIITHGPLFGILDETPIGDRAGCEDLQERIEEIRPLAHIFGHIHHGYGTAEKFGVKFVNAAVCDEGYAPVNQPIILDL